ncbi:MAG: helix-turn-helix domain-containing protein [Rhodospirillaceae bacterium]|nr:helix-turn-helix domain-containing protein [Rhodospirillaceae bacterium]
METVKSLERGLDVLDALVALGSGTVRAVARRAGLTQQATYRCLESLRHKGFAHRNSYREPYRATALHLNWCARLPPEIVLMDAARAPMAELTRRLKWPAVLTAVGDLNLRILETTDHLPGRHRGQKGMRRLSHGASVAFFERPSWALYQAGLTPERARALFREVVARHGAQLFVRDQDFHDMLLARIRTRGYVVFEPLRGPESSVAVPLRVLGGQFFGLELRFIAADVKTAAIKAEFVPALKGAAHAIAAAAAPGLAAGATLAAAVDARPTS